MDLFNEKVGLKPTFEGNMATDWGASREVEGLERYKAVTGHAVQACRFRVLREDDAHGWLGASPDGLVDGLLASPGTIPVIPCSLFLFQVSLFLPAVPVCFVSVPFFPFRLVWF